MLLKSFIIILTEKCNCHHDASVTYLKNVGGFSVITPIGKTFKGITINRKH